ncbi:MAG: hypothetical protein PUK49_10335, partial [Oscillospiraceae bacterium]|nr:hypothetical protein [Oscillospiraceae bacterium]
MKLKKILASLTATALAVSVMAFTPSVSQNFEVSAATDKTLFSGTKTLSAWNECGGYEVGEDKPIQAADLDAYTNISITLSTDTLPDENNDWQADQLVKVYCKAYGAGYEYSADENNNKSVYSPGIIKGKSGLSANTEYTIDFAISDLLDDFQKVVHAGDEAKSVISAFEIQSAYQATNAKVTITKIALTGASSTPIVPAPGEDEDEEKEYPIDLELHEINLKVGDAPVTNRLLVRSDITPDIYVTIKNDDGAVDISYSEDNPNTFVITPVKAGYAELRVYTTWVNYNDKNGVTSISKDAFLCPITVTDDSTNTDVIVESPAGITATVDQSELIDAVGLTPEEIAAGTKIVLNIESAASVSE